MLLDPIGIMVLTLPLPILLVETYGFDLIWFGVVAIMAFPALSLLIPGSG